MESATSASSAPSAPRRPAAFRPYKKRAAELTASLSSGEHADQETSVPSSLAPLDLRKKTTAPSDLMSPGQDSSGDSAAAFREAAEWYSKYAAAAAYMLSMPGAAASEWDARWRQYNLLALQQQQQQQQQQHLPLPPLPAGIPAPMPPGLQLPSPLLRGAAPGSNYEALCAAAVAAAAAQHLPNQHPLQPVVPLATSRAPPQSSPVPPALTLAGSQSSPSGLKRRAMTHSDTLTTGRLKYSNFFAPAAPEKLQKEKDTAAPVGGSNPSTAAVVAAATAATIAESTETQLRDSSLPLANGTNSKETDFLCSCGQTYVNLYQFTVHLRESGHRQRSAQRERDIPKLVRGQDMWINSETEQTREILRCIRCKQSFRTLPDLTMHMIQTKHYAEIVYNDSGRCVYVNNNNNNNNGAAQHQPTDEASAPKIPKKFSPSPAVVGMKSGLHRTFSSRTEVTEADSASGEPEEVPMEVKEEDGASTHPSIHQNLPVIPQCAEPLTPAALPHMRTPGSPPESPSSSEPPPVLQQIQSFVEKSLPAAPGRRPTSTMFREVLSANELEPVGSDSLLMMQNSGRGAVPSTTTTSDRSITATNQVYLAPDNGSTRPDENPLSSLQKLVDTTDTRRRAAAAAAAAAISDNSRGASPCLRSPEMSDSPSPALTSTAVTSSSSFLPSSPTVIMVNPTYIYQPAFPPPVPPVPYYSPWVHALPLFGAGMGTMEPEKENTGAPGDAVDLSNGRRSTSPAPGTSTADTLDTSSSTNSDVLGGPLRLSWTDSGGPQHSNGGGTLQKKAKCNFCGKPFANKGQVRLHISKGKCPNLLPPRCRSPGAAAAAAHSILSSPFSYMPLDYMSAAAAAAASMAQRGGISGPPPSSSTATSNSTTTSITGANHLLQLHQAAAAAVAAQAASSVSSSTGAPASTSCNTSTASPALQVSPNASKKAEERLRMYCNLAKELSSTSSNSSSSSSSSGCANRTCDKPTAAL